MSIETLLPDRRYCVASCGPCCNDCDYCIPLRSLCVEFVYNVVIFVLDSRVFLCSTVECVLIDSDSSDNTFKQ